ncbi:MAG: class I SAM-dependent methyltransferase [Holosporaceae bacterium]|nr:MAG: class I SAM-dependent methyltransferase [Holosporaceae bacterium]
MMGASDAVQVHFVQQDAWTMEEEEIYDVIASNGLNIYVDDEQAQALYAQFLKALKPRGVLVTSFLTPPPMLDAQSPWKMDQLDMAALAKQRALMQDVIDAQWIHFRTEQVMYKHLVDAGVMDVKVIYDSKGGVSNGCGL